MYPVLAGDRRGGISGDGQSGIDGDIISIFCQGENSDADVGLHTHTNAHVQMRLVLRGGSCGGADRRYGRGGVFLDLLV